jgi:hypothetical protein
MSVVRVAQPRGKGWVRGRGSGQGKEGRSGGTRLSKSCMPLSQPTPAYPCGLKGRRVHSRTSLFTVVTNVVTNLCHESIVSGKSYRRKAFLLL